MRLDIDKLTEISKNFSHLKRREVGPKNRHRGTFEGVSYKRVKSILRFQLCRQEEREEKQRKQNRA